MLDGLERAIRLRVHLAVLAQKGPDLHLFPGVACLPDGLRRTGPNLAGAISVGRPSMRRLQRWGIDQRDRQNHCQGTGKASTSAAGLSSAGHISPMRKGKVKVRTDRNIGKINRTDGKV
ncbi:hypothetical protein [Actinoallomurus sp. NPDC052274]|uniref:hypothetical protein n=1 Tax=Actinoallomurus sp. NPDC052274 TaxID=3155420 RepID=UPI0034318436